MDRARADE
jgi:uncharacterized C2H2 Zn-finger protein